MFELTYQDCTWVRSLTASAADLKLNVYCFISIAEDTRLTVGRESNMIGYESMITQSMGNEPQGKIWEEDILKVVKYVGVSV